MRQKLHRLKSNLWNNHCPWMTGPYCTSKHFSLITPTSVCLHVRHPSFSFPLKISKIFVFITKYLTYGNIFTTFSGMVYSNDPDNNKIEENKQHMIHCWFPANVEIYILFCNDVTQRVFPLYDLWSPLRKDSLAVNLSLKQPTLRACE